MRVSSALILILTVTVTLLSMAQTRRLSREENQERLKECGILKKSGGAFLVQLKILTNGRKTDKYQSGALISKRHVITHPSSLDQLAFNCQPAQQDPSTGVCRIPISEGWMKNLKVSTCGTDSDCRTRNNFQTPSSALYIGPRASTELGILLLQFDTNFHDQATFPLCLDEGQFEFGDKLFLVGLGKETDSGTIGIVRKSNTKGEKCQNNDTLYVCTPAIGCPGDLGAPFIAKPTQQDNRWRIVAIASADACQDKKSVNQHLLVNKFTDFICDFSGVCSGKSGSTARISGKPTTTTPRMPTTSRTSKKPTSEPTTPAATRKATSMPTTKPITTAASTSTSTTTSASTTTTVTTTLPPTTKATTTVTPSPRTSSEPSKPTTASMSTLDDLTSSTITVEVDTTSSSVSPTSTTPAPPLLRNTAKQKQNQETSTTPVVVIDIEDEPGLEDEEEEETEYVYIDEPDVSSRDTSVLLVLIFLSFIFLFP